jgi:HAMP domain-containing protein
MIVDKDGKVLYATDKAREGAPATDPGSRKALEAPEPLVQEYEDEDGDLYEKVIPLVGPDGKKMGVFRIALKGSAVNRPLRDLLLWSLMVGAVVFAAATYFVTLFMKRAVTDPLREMAATAAQMTAGDLSRSVTVSGKTEIAALSTRFPPTSARCSAGSIR